MCPHQPVGTVPTSQRDRLVRALALTRDGQTTTSATAQTSINHFFVAHAEEQPPDATTPSIELSSDETDSDIPDLVDGSQASSSSSSSEDAGPGGWSEPGAGEWFAPHADGHSNPEADDFSVLSVAVGKRRNAATATRRRGVGTPHGFRPSADHTQATIEKPVLLYEDDVLVSPAVLAVVMGVRALSTMSRVIDNATNGSGVLPLWNNPSLQTNPCLIIRPIGHSTKPSRSSIAWSI